MEYGGRELSVLGAVHGDEAELKEGLRVALSEIYLLKVHIAERAANELQAFVDLRPKRFKQNVYIVDHVILAKLKGVFNSVNKHRFVVGFFFPAAIECQIYVVTQHICFKLGDFPEHKVGIGDIEGEIERDRWDLDYAERRLSIFFVIYNQLVYLEVREEFDVERDVRHMKFYLLTRLDKDEARLFSIVREICNVEL